MKKHVACVLVLLVFVFPPRPAHSQSRNAPPENSSSKNENTLPVPGYRIPMDIKAWKRTLTVVKMTYSKDDNNITFLVKAKRNFSFQDDGYDAIFEFLDKDGVNMVKTKNVSWEDPPKSLRANQVTRVTLELPDEDILKETKKAQAVVKGFFNK